MYCVRGKEMLRDLQRSDWLPPYDDEGIRTIYSEMNSATNNIVDYCEQHNINEDNDNTILPQDTGYIDYLRTAYLHNGRIIHAYIQHRLKLIRNVRWETGKCVCVYMCIYVCVCVCVCMYVLLLL